MAPLSLACKPALCAQRLPARQLWPHLRCRRAGRSGRRRLPACDRCKPTPSPRVQASSRRGQTEERPPPDALITPDGRAAAFGRAARKRLPPALAERIRQLNPLDDLLWRTAGALLDVSRGAAPCCAALSRCAPPCPAAARPAITRRLARHAVQAGAAAGGGPAGKRGAAEAQEGAAQEGAPDGGRRWRQRHRRRRRRAAVEEAAARFSGLWQPRRALASHAGPGSSHVGCNAARSSSKTKRRT